jgi:hypothetical protein
MLSVVKASSIQVIKRGVLFLNWLSPRYILGTLVLKLFTIKKRGGSFQSTNVQNTPFDKKTRMESAYLIAVFGYFFVCQVLPSHFWLICRFCLSTCLIKMWGDQKCKTTTCLEILNISWTDAFGWSV